MLQQKINLFGLGVALVGFCISIPVLGDGVPEEIDENMIAQSDSEEFLLQELNTVDENTKKALLEMDEKGKKDSSPAQKMAVADIMPITKEENVATITAEGDFKVPTFMLQDFDKSETNVQKTEEKIHTNTVKSLPVVKITQTELVPVREQMAVERRLTGKTTKTTALYKEALARSQVTTPDDHIVESDSDKEEVSLGKRLGFQGTIKKKKLLLPLKGTLRVKEEEEDLSGTEPLYKVYGSETADKVLSKAMSGNESLLMPQDIKVTFYPYSTEFSGQTVKWIKVFSMRARNDPRYTVEIRLSKEQPQIQQKRLFVIRRILMNNGLSMHQIAIDYVNRPADSIILRMVKKQDGVQTKKTFLKNGVVQENKTINW